MEENRDFRFALEQNVTFTKKQFSQTIKKVKLDFKKPKNRHIIKTAANDKLVLANIISLAINF